MRNEYDILNDAKIDLSVYEDFALSEKEKKAMKKTNYKKLAVLAACICALGVISQTAFAKDMFGRLVKMISTGRNQFYQYDMTGAEAPLPESLIGMVFDENKNAVSTYKNGEQYFDKNGAAISDWEKFFNENAGENLQISLKKKDGDPLEKAEKVGWLVLKDENEINNYLCYSAKLPGYLPEGFSFYGASVGEDSKYYLQAYYMNERTGEYFSVSERFINEETAFETGSDDEIIETQINGCKAVIMGGRNVFWEEEGISIAVQSRGVFAEDELLKVARSVK